MELIILSGYTDEEKLDIAQTFWFQKILKNMAFLQNQFILTKPILVM